MSRRKQAVLGILGGGQLARMLALAAAPLGINTWVVDGSADACAGQVAHLLQAEWNDYQKLAQFAAQVDAVTFDFENVPATVARWLAERVSVVPTPAALAVAQDRLEEKTLFKACDLATPAFMAVNTREDLDQALREIGAPAILKTRRLGYDGKGQFRIRHITDAAAAWAALGAQAATVGLILEAFVPFEREMSIIAVRSRHGECRAWPLTQNWHHEGILSFSLAPAPQADLLQQQAEAFAFVLAERLGYVGVFAVEFFVKDGKLLGNEMAPRVHNSGHWTIEGARTSQFENHVRAVMGLPLGDTSAFGWSLMCNWIGELPDAMSVLSVPDAHWHDYGKQARLGRKVGHATVCAADAQSMASRLQTMAHALGCVQQISPVLEELYRLAAGDC